MHRELTKPLLLISGLCIGGIAMAQEIDTRYDIIVYGATPSGITASVAAKRAGKNVLLVEPSRWVGGILVAGIKPGQDAPFPEKVGGIGGWVLSNIRDYNDSVRLAQFRELLADEGIEPLYEYRFRSLTKEDTRIRSVVFENAPPGPRGCPIGAAPADAATISVQADYFIDATYEGHLMKAAGVSYAVGRESRDTYDEDLAGVGNFTNFTPIDPYVEKGNPESGLLPFVDEDHGLPKGSGDDYTQAYNFRMYVTTETEHHAPKVEIEPYDPAKYELVGRYVEYLVSRGKKDNIYSIFPGWRNERDYNYKRESLFSISPLGASRYYQDGDYETQSRIWKDHMAYLDGIHRFLSTDSRVPADVRETIANTWLDKRHHPDTHGWPNQLYIRISRRMEGEYTLTLADVRHETTIHDPIGYAAYGVDTYPTRRAVTTKDGNLGVASEGNMFVGRAEGTGSYAVPYRIITPKREECTNLLVTVCYSASYIAYASSRMEPVYMVLGESAGIAAAMAHDRAVAVQELDYSDLREKLLEAGQVLPDPDPVGVRPASSPLRVMSANDATPRTMHDLMGRHMPLSRAATKTSVSEKAFAPCIVSAEGNAGVRIGRARYRSREDRR